MAAAPVFSLEPFAIRPPTEAHAPAARRYQGIPGFERLPSGRMFAVWYGGELRGEGPGNYVILAMAEGEGRPWRERLVVGPDARRAERERAYDAVLWRDPRGRLWWCWTQAHSTANGDVFDGRAGVWAAVCDEPDRDEPVWSAPRRLGEGVMMNKPTVLHDGGWVFPAALWSSFPEKILPDYAEISRPNLLLTRDEGKTFTRVTGPDMPRRCFDEHMLVEKRDHAWWMLVRTYDGIGESVSEDGGRTWSVARDAGLGGPNSRFAIRRLRSGRLILVNHQTSHYLPGESRGTAWGRVRDNLTAWLSDDDGASWHGRMMIDERPDVSYPDLVEGEDGFLYVAYDHGRMRLGQILLARFTEDDVRAGFMRTPGAYTRRVIAAFPRMRD